jgi:hypothetical protein
VGQRYCEELANKADAISGSERSIAIALIGIAGASMLASGALTIANGVLDDNQEALAYASGGLALVPILLVPWGGVLWTRADEAGSLATVSASAAAEPNDREAYRRCTLAKASWVGSRAGATALAREALEDDSEDDDDDDDAQDGAADPTTPVTPRERSVDDKKMQLVLELLQRGRADEARELMESDVGIIED